MDSGRLDSIGIRRGKMGQHLKRKKNNKLHGFEEQFTDLKLLERERAA